MTKGEKKLIEAITKYKSLLFFLAVSLIGAYVRYNARAFISEDMSYYLLDWFDQIKENGIFSLKEQVGNYNILYQTMIALMTYIPWKPVYLIKCFSILFDYLLAFSVADFIRKQFGEHRKSLYFLVPYGVVLLLPTVVLNSAYWGQCDAMYTFFIFEAMVTLYEEKYRRCFFLFGIALAFKLQAIFFLPFVICLYFYRKKFSLFNLLITIGSFWLSGLPAYFMGRGLLTPFSVYIAQSDEYRAMYLNISSFWIFVGGHYDFLKSLAMGVTILLLGIGLLVVMSGRKKLDTPEEYLGFLCWTLWTCTMYLPAMHERYTFLLDIMLIALVAVQMRYLPYAVLSVLLSTITYGNYLFQNGAVDKYFAAVQVGMWFAFTYQIFLKQTASPQAQVSGEACQRDGGENEKREGC